MPKCWDSFNSARRLKSYKCGWSKCTNLFVAAKEWRAVGLGFWKSLPPYLSPSVLGAWSSQLSRINLHRGEYPDQVLKGLALQLPSLIALGVFLHLWLLINFLLEHVQLYGTVPLLCARHSRVLISRELVRSSVMQISGRQPSVVNLWQLRTGLFSFCWTALMIKYWFSCTGKQAKLGIVFN